MNFFKMEQRKLEDFPWVQLCNRYCTKLGFKKVSFRFDGDICNARIGDRFHVSIPMRDTKTKTKNTATYELMMQISGMIELPNELIDWITLVRYYCLHKYGVEPVYTTHFNVCAIEVPGVHIFSDIPSVHKDKLKEIVSYKYYRNFICEGV